VDDAGLGSLAKTKLQSDGDEQYTCRAAPIVKVRAGDHGDFERIVFEWPDAIAHDVIQEAEQVTVAFAQPGRSISRTSAIASANV
jgi:hypothetical protein